MNTENRIGPIRIYLIRKNTPELRNKLEDFGFEKNQYMSDYEYEDPSKYLTFIYDKPEWVPQILVSCTNSILIISPVTVDCGTDESLFLSCAEMYKK